MRILFLLVALSATLFSFPSYSCNSKTKLGISRTIKIDTRGGALYGTVQYQNTIDLKPGEVILTFDDGPHPKNTVSILQTLKDHCTRATFFVVGQMVRTYPHILKKVAYAGHTIAAHTHTHTNMQSLSLTRAKYEIERSFAEAIFATGRPVAPFFRYPGLAHSKAMNRYLASRNIATLSVDVISDDTLYPSTRSIIRTTMSRLKKKKSGIILLHDLKKATAQALPHLLNELKKEGYKVVHIVPRQAMKKANYKPRPYDPKTRLALRKIKTKKKKSLLAHNSNLRNLRRPLKACLFLFLGCAR